MSDIHNDSMALRLGESVLRAWSSTSSGASSKKKLRRCGEEDEAYGDTWDHVAVNPITKLVVSLEVGKRTEEMTKSLVMDAKSRLAEGCLPSIFTDAYEKYKEVNLEAFGRRYLVARKGNRGRRPKPKLRRPHGMVYAQVKKHYRGRRLERVEVRPIFGKTNLKAVLESLRFNKVNTSAIESYNGTSRQRSRHKVRKTLAFSKEGRYHRWMSWLSATL